jgi:carbonic anhydrase
MLHSFTFLAALVSIVESSCLYGTSHLERRVTENNTVPVSKFGYTGQVGPLLWQTLAAENALCEQGVNQSPINIGELLFPSVPNKFFSMKMSDKVITVAIMQMCLETGNNTNHPHQTDKTIKTATESPKIKITNAGSNEFENLGTTVEVIANGTTEFGGKTFNLKQFHFHSPSEHRINEEYFPLEMHMVHEAAGKFTQFLIYNKDL